MAKTRAVAIGHDNNRIKEVSRLGATAAEVEAATRKTYVHAMLFSDGGGWVCVTRGEKVIHKFDIPVE